VADFYSEICSKVKAMLEPRGFATKSASPPDARHMGGWLFEMESPEFLIVASQDRTDDVLGICLASKIRRKPSAPMRGPWSLGHLRAYIDGLRDHYRFANAADQLAWLETNLTCLLDTSLLNSDDLNEWALEASRRMFGHKPM